jgi:hypothetical protein
MLRTCPSESELEKLVESTDMTAEFAHVEEHVLLCSRCGEWLESELQFIQAMRQAASSGLLLMASPALRSSRQ